MSLRLGLRYGKWPEKTHWFDTWPGLACVGARLFKEGLVVVKWASGECSLSGSLSKTLVMQCIYTIAKVSITLYHTDTLSDHKALGPVFPQQINLPLI